MERHCRAARTQSSAFIESSMFLIVMLAIGAADLPGGAINACIVINGDARIK